MKISKRFKAMQSKVAPGKTYAVDEALKRKEAELLEV